MGPYLAVQPSTVRPVTATKKLRRSRLLSPAVLFVAAAMLLASAEGVTETEALWTLRSQQENPQEAIATWDDSTEPCLGWQGVTCVEGAVTELALGTNQLTGTLPAEFSALSSLTSLSLPRNNLTGVVPVQLSTLTRLELLRLDANKLTGAIPQQLSVLSSLYRVDLDNNALTGTVPSQLSVLSRLTTLYLNGNQLTGAMPAQLSTLTKLELLWLDANKLIGAVPQQLSVLSSLYRVDLDNNALTGTVPPQLSALSGLKTLYLNSNELTGTVPAQLSALSRLELLYLYGNQLEGTLPAQLSALSSLTYFDVSNNFLTLGDFVSETLQLGTQRPVVDRDTSSNDTSNAVPPPPPPPSLTKRDAVPPPVGIPPPRAELMDTPSPSTADELFGLPTAAVIGGIGAAVALAVAGIVIAIYRCYKRSTKRMASAGNYEQDRYPYMEYPATTRSAAPRNTHSLFMDLSSPAKNPYSSSPPFLAFTGHDGPYSPSIAAVGSTSSPVTNGEKSLWPDTTAALEAQLPDRNVPLDPEHIGHEVYNLHVTLPDDLSKPPMRLVHIYPVVNHWQTLPVYETMPECDYIEVPYCEASNTYWDVTCMLSWRWANGKSPDIDEAASPMSEQQFSELQRKLKLAADAGMKYVWIDWCCVPQYDGNPMVEIHRSRLYYARARALIVLPGFRALSETPMMVILLTHAQLMLAKSTGEDAASDRLISQALKRIIDAKACASREYFGRVWTLAERMARHARKEKLCEWLSLDLWLGMVVDAMLGGKNDAAAAIYWQKLFPSEVLEQLSSVEQEINLALEASHASKNLYKAVAELCRSGYQVWASMALQEEATTEWLQTYLLEEAGQVYGAFNKNDIVWSIYCFFCYEQDVTASKALGNLCRIANVNIADSRMYKSIVAAQKELEN